MKRILAVLVLLAACHSNPTGVKPPQIDPSVQVVNQSPDVVHIIFASDQSGTLIYDTIPVPAGATVCARWTQSFDSLFTRVLDTMPNVTGHYTEADFPWIHFSVYPNYFSVDTVRASAQAITQDVVGAEC
ncbi:MAG TPA: hypothetical protein VNG95_05100 [Gemmatimonadales bacterium]|nr:hypothetical protein [Gemmatimonadales bacterium]